MTYSETRKRIVSVVWTAERRSDQHFWLVLRWENCHGAWDETAARRRILHDLSPYWTGACCVSKKDPGHYSATFITSLSFRTYNRSSLLCQGAVPSQMTLVTMWCQSTLSSEAVMSCIGLTLYTSTMHWSYPDTSVSDVLSLSWVLPFIIPVRSTTKFKIVVIDDKKK